MVKFVEIKNRMLVSLVCSMFTVYISSAACPFSTLLPHKVGLAGTAAQLEKRSRTNTGAPT